MRDIPCCSWKMYVHVAKTVVDTETAHRVNLSDYFIGQYEVTQDQWMAVMGNDPSYFTGAVCRTATAPCPTKSTSMSAFAWLLVQNRSVLADRQVPHSKKRKAIRNFN